MGSQCCGASYPRLPRSHQTLPSLDSLQRERMERRKRNQRSIKTISSSRVSLISCVVRSSDRTSHCPGSTHYNAREGRDAREISRRSKPFSSSRVFLISCVVRSFPLAQVTARPRFITTREKGKTQEKSAVDQNHFFLSRLSNLLRWSIFPDRTSHCTASIHYNASGLRAKLAARLGWVKVWFALDWASDANGRGLPFYFQRPRFWLVERLVRARLGW